MSETGQHWINDQWVDGQGEVLTSTSPADEQVIWQGQAATASQVDHAVISARRASPSWIGIPVAERIEIIHRYAAIVKDNAEQLAMDISREMGKPFWESKTEAAAVAGKAGLAIDAYRQRRDTVEFEMGDALAATRYKPLGVVGVLGPFNFPAHLPNGHIIPAILAGNTVVFKPSEMTPAVGQRMMQYWQQAGLPNGVINLVQGGRETGAALASHSQLDGLFFTGSSNAGRALHRLMADHPEKVLALEMGGNNPLIVHQCSDLQAAAYLTVLSAYISAGQRCTCARRLIVVDQAETDQFLETLVAMIGRVRAGRYDDRPEPFLGTVVSSQAAQQLIDGQQQLIRNGGTALVEMTRSDRCAALVTPGLIDVTSIENASDHEYFGPLLQVIRVKNFDEAIDRANQTSYGLSAGLLCDDHALYEQFFRHIRAGVVNWNRQITGASGKLPFGGVGLSGNHRPSGYFAADYCSYPVASMETEKAAMPEKMMPGFDDA